MIHVKKISKFPNSRPWITITRLLCSNSDDPTKSFFDGYRRMLRENFPTKRHNFLGVSQIGKHWCASIIVKDKKIELGKFETPREAAKAYDQAALKFHGRNATLNFDVDGQFVDFQSTKYSRYGKTSK